MSVGVRVVGWTALALACFAGNSILCRLALAEGHIDATSFTVVRIMGGAAALVVLARGRRPDGRTPAARWTSAFVLFAYAAPFSYAYLRLGAAMGALILFATVQVTMVGWGIAKGERPRALAWVGIVVAVSGLVVLTAPGTAAPDSLGTLEMVVAGLMWGAYSLLGRGLAGDPVATTSSSFVNAVPLAVALALGVLPWAGAHASPRGIALALASGAITSGVGYSLWYAALRHLSATRAAVLQLLVPVIAAGGAMMLLGETPTRRLVVASVAILGGVGVTIAARAARG